MKVESVRTFVVGNPPPHYGGRYFVFLKLVTDDGIEGFGEVYGATFGPQTVAAMIEDVCARHVVGADPFRIEALWRDVYGRGYSLRPDISLVGVLSGIEMACWDIVGKAVGKPVYDLLGGQVHERLRSYSYLYPEDGDATDVYVDPELGATRAAEYVARGFTAVKFDPAGAYTTLDPHQPSLDDLELSERYVRTVREAVGDRCDLLFGTHGQFTTSGAIRLAKRLEPYDPLWFEEPTPPEMPEEMARVARATSIPIASGERLTTKYEFARVHRDRCRVDPADEPRARRWDPRGEEDRRDGRGALRADRAAPLLRAGRRRGEHPARDVQPELPRARGYPGVGWLPRRDPEDGRFAGRTGT